MLLRQTGGVGTNRPLFQRTDLQKNAGITEYILCLEGGFVSPKRVPKTACGVVWRIFASNKSAPATL